MAPGTSGGRVGLILRSASTVLVIRFAGIAISLIASLLAARALAPAGRGELAVMFAVPGLLSTVAVLGLDTANLFFAAQGSGDHRRILRYSITYAIGVGAAVTAAAVALAIAFPIVRFGLSVPVFAACTALTIPLIAGTLLTAAEAGRGRVVRAIAANAFALAVYPVGIAALMLLHRAGPGELFVVYAASQVATTAVLVILSLRDRASLETAARIGPYLRFAIRANPSALALLLMVRVQVPLLQTLAGPVAVGLYATALPLAEVLLIVPTILTLVLLPRSARQAVTRGDVIRLVVLTSLFAAASAVVIGLAAPWLIPLLFGDPYAGSVPILWVLLPGIVLLGAARVAQINMLARRRFATPTLAAIGGLSVAVIGLLFWIPRLGAVGAALAATLAFATVAAITAVAALPQLLRVLPVRASPPRQP